MERHVLHSFPGHALPKRTTLTFVILLDVVNPFANMTYPTIVAFSVLRQLDSNRC